MKIEKLNEVLKNFQENSDRTILIDGPWGCGKTHCILDFLKEEKKNKKSKNKSSITYLSLFGKTSVDEIHLELYRNFHKAKHISKKIINVLPKIMNDAILENNADESNEILPAMIEKGYVYCKNGIVYPNFYVFNKESYKAICELFAPVSKYIKSYMEQIYEKAATELCKVTPGFLKNQCEIIARLHFSLNSVGTMINELIENGSLIVPKEKTNLAIWGINHK